MKLLYQRVTSNKEHNNERYSISLNMNAHGAVDPYLSYLVMQGIWLSNNCLPLEKSVSKDLWQSRRTTHTPVQPNLTIFIISQWLGTITVLK